MERIFKGIPIILDSNAKALYEKSTQIGKIGE